jgi:hypothetical protein
VIEEAFYWKFFHLKGEEEKKYNKIKIFFSEGNSLNILHFKFIPNKDKYREGEKTFQIFTKCYHSLSHSLSLIVLVSKLDFSVMLHDEATRMLSQCENEWKFECRRVKMSLKLI